MESEPESHLPPPEGGESDPLADLSEARSLREDLLASAAGADSRDQLDRLDREQARAAEWSAEKTIRALRRAARLISTEMDPRSLGRQILDVAVQTTQAERGVLFLGQGQGGFVPMLAIDLKGEELDQVERLSRTLLEHGQKGEILITADAMHDPRFERVPSVQLKEIRSVLCVPLVLQGRILGVLYLDAPSRPNAFAQDVGGFLEPFAELAAFALENARRHADLVAENFRLRQQREPRLPFERLVRLSPQMHGLIERAALAARVDGTVLILGEAGSGKSLLAEEIHEASERALHPFVTWNCEALAEEIPMDRARGGGRIRAALAPVVRAAAGGTLFLDEIGDMVPVARLALLNSLLEMVAGTDRNRPGQTPEVRLILSSGRAIHEDSDLEHFHRELTRRMNVLILRIPPLRKRSEDIPLLLNHFLEKHRSTRDRPSQVGFTLEAQEFLQKRPWPGNVRELEILAQRVLILADRPEIGVEELKRLSPVSCGDEVAARTSSTIRASGQLDRVLALAEREREVIREALVRTRGNKSRAAQLLGLHRNTLMRKLRELSSPGARGDTRRS